MSEHIELHPETENGTNQHSNLREVDKPAEHHSSRRARVLIKDRTRQQALRDRKKAAKSPSTHTINRAIVHAIMAELKAQRSQGVKVGDVSLSFVNILDLSYKHLTKGTHAGNSYSLDEVRIAITARIQREAPKPGDD